MTLLKTITSQIISLTDKSTTCISISELSHLYSIRYGKYIAKIDGDPLNNTEHLSRVIIEIGQSNLIIEVELDQQRPEETNKLAQDKQKQYILLTNKLRTLIDLKKVNEIIDLIENNPLVNFVDTESLELIKEVIKSSMH